MIDPVKAAKIRAEVKRRECYKRLTTRKFATPKGYRSYEEIALIMALNVEIAEIGLALSQHRWIWLCACDMFGRAIVDNYFPVYRVDRELIELLLETDDPEVFGQELPRPFDCALFLLPEGLIEIGNWRINWLLIDVVDQSEPKHDFTFSGEVVTFERLSEGDRIRYRWVSQTQPMKPNSPGDMFISTFGYDNSGTELEREFVTKTAEDKLVTTLLSKLAKNLLLWVYKPTEYEYMETHRGQGFGGKKQPEKEPIRYPIKLGISEQPRRIYKPTERNTDDDKVTRRSPFPHRRKSHWRRVPVGKRDEGKRELKLIRRSFVGKPAD